MSFNESNTVEQMILDALSADNTGSSRSFEDRLGLRRPSAAFACAVCQPTNEVFRLLQSGAEATALQTLARLTSGLKLCEASGVRRVHRRCRAHDSPTNERDASPVRKHLMAVAFRNLRLDFGAPSYAVWLGLWTYGAGVGGRETPGGVA